MPEDVTLNSSIEIHDSEIAAVERDSLSVKIHLSPAYVHKSVGEPGVDPGTGWVQNVVLTIEEGDVKGEIPNMPCDLSTGTLNVGQRLWSNCIPLPFDCIGDVTLTLVGMWGGEIVVQGRRILSVSIGEAKYVENFDPGTRRRET